VTGVAFLGEDRLNVLFEVDFPVGSLVSPNAEDNIARRSVARIAASYLDLEPESQELITYDAGERTSLWRCSRSAGGDFDDRMGPVADGNSKVFAIR